MAVAKEGEHQGVADKDDVHDEQDPSLSMMPTCKEANFHIGFGSPQIRPQRCPQPNNSIKAVYAAVMSNKSRKYVSTCSQLRFLQGCPERRLRWVQMLFVRQCSTGTWHQHRWSPTGEAGLRWHGTSMCS